MTLLYVNSLTEVCSCAWTS